MAEPTPGPWTVGKAEKRGWPIEAERTALEYRVVAMAYSPEDARLIAKARHLPEVVCALEALWRQHVRTVERAVDLLNEHGYACDSAEEQLRAHAHMTGVHAALALVQDEDRG